MAKLPNFTPKAGNTKLRGTDDEGVPSMPQMDVVAKVKRGFEVTSPDALRSVYPQFFKYTPDYAKIRQAIKLGLSLPGVSFIDQTIPMSIAELISTGASEEENAA